jgi:hypothetical protein
VDDHPFPVNFLLSNRQPALRFLCVASYQECVAECDCIARNNF